MLSLFVQNSDSVAFQDPEASSEPLAHNLGKGPFLMVRQAFLFSDTRLPFRSPSSFVLLHPKPALAHGPPVLSFYI